MADYSGQESAGVLHNLNLSTLTLAYDRPTAVTAAGPGISMIGAPVGSKTAPASVPVVDWSGQEMKGPEQYFFERVWALPSSIELGSIISTITTQIEIYNAYRNSVRTFTSATANAGPGVSLSGLPSLPGVLVGQAGVVFNVVASTSGPPEIDGTLDFVLDTGALAIPITGSRVILFPYEPESPIIETLQFKTDVLLKRDGTEQRVSVRKHPRQIFEMDFKLEEGQDRRTFHTKLFGTQAGVFGVPVWFEARPLQADAVSGGSAITVDTTYADFRVGSLAILWSSPSEFEALEINSMTDNSITFTSTLSSDFSAVDTIVMPLRLSRTDSAAKGQKYLNNLDQFRMKFTIIDNEADLADTTAWNSHGSKVLLDDPNWSGGAPAIEDSIMTSVGRIDNGSAPIEQFTDWIAAQYQSTKGFIANSPEQVWRIRQLVHALRGSQVTFYIPSFYTDVVSTAPLGAGSNEITIEHIGYTDFVNGRDPLGALWVLRTDGTVLSRTVTASIEVDANTERLTLDDVWGSDVTLDEIDRISFMRLCRIANDEVKFEHLHAGTARAAMSILGVQQ